MTAASIEETVDSSSAAKVAVVVPIHRWNSGVETCLDALAKLDPPPAEIALGLDGLDLRALPEATTESLAQQSTLHIWHNTSGEPEGPAKARNGAAALCRSEILLFLDSDVLAPRQLIAQITAEFASDRSLIGFIGSYDDEPAAPGLVSQFRNLLHHHEHQVARPFGNTFWGACGAIQANAFLQAGGFPEHYRRASIEDVELGMRLGDLGIQIARCPTVQVKHLKRWSLKTMLAADIWDRAVPWTRLAFRRGGLDDDLNVAWRGRIACGATFLSLFAAIWSMAYPHPWSLIALFMSLSICLIADGPFITFLVKKRGLDFALASLPLRALFFLSAGATYGLVQLQCRFLHSPGGTQSTARKRKEAI